MSVKYIQIFQDQFGDTKAYKNGRLSYYLLWGYAALIWLFIPLLKDMPDTVLYSVLTIGALITLAARAAKPDVTTAVAWVLIAYPAYMRFQIAESAITYFVYLSLALSILTYFSSSVRTWNVLTLVSTFIGSGIGYIALHNTSWQILVLYALAGFTVSLFSIDDLAHYTASSALMWFVLLYTLVNKSLIGVLLIFVYVIGLWLYDKKKVHTLNPGAGLLYLYNPRKYVKQYRVRIIHRRATFGEFLIGLIILVLIIGGYILSIPQFKEIMRNLLF